METKLLPEITEPLVVFGGPYSNLQALKAMHDICRELSIPPERTICTGDIVAYCARPGESIEFIRDWGIHVIAGNVELQLAAEQADCGCNFTEGSVCDALSNKWYAFAKQQITQKQIQWLGQLPRFIRFTISGYHCVIVHGSYSETAKFIYHSTKWDDKLAELELANTDIILAGHCGIPFLQSQHDKVWANAGVIGMPTNDGTNFSWYLTLTQAEEQLIFETHTFKYDHETAAKEIEVQDLAVQYATSLRTGIWPSNDILPEIERSQQGRPILPQKLSVPVLL
ncbi:MAG: metallophosphoesterase family protein [Gammaproteobacteria bacterium]|jgi:predicted phosphodiesterase